MQGMAEWNTCALDSQYPFFIGCDFAPDSPLLW